jgi:hypothetical protein
MKKLIILVAIFVALGMSKVNAQGYKGEGLMIGPTIGLSYGLGIGATGDYALNDKWSLGGDIMWSQKTTTVFTTDYKQTLIGVLVAASYHFDFMGKDWDPFLKGGLGYLNWSSPSGLSGGSASGIGFILNAGARYYLNQKTALRFQLGFPFYVGVGIDFKL